MGLSKDMLDNSDQNVVIGPKSRERIVSALLICAQLNVAPSEICAKYEATNFANSSISKLDTFLQILKDKSISREFSEYANLRLGNSDLATHRDVRSSVEYATELITGWIVEDAFVKWLGGLGLECELKGNDSSRELLTSASMISTKPDIHLTRSNRFIELIADYHDYWHKNRRCHLRNDKYRNLVEEQAVLIGISQHGIHLIDFNDSEVLSRIDQFAVYISKHKPYGNKPAWEIQFSQPLELETVAERLLLL